MAQIRAETAVAQGGDASASLANLEAEFRLLAGRISADSARRQVLEGLIKQRRAQAAARAKVQGMDPIEREALKAVLNEADED